uniref:Sulfatase domain-containing protein n=2 Tax=Hymenolepis diminuta TaxID=6216 RepID=A0A0R3SV63_HYMDI
LTQFFNKSSNEVNCNANGLRFTIEKPRENVAVDAILPKRAWLDHGFLKIEPEHDRYKCDAFPIFPLDEYRSVYGDPFIDVKSGQLLPRSQIMLLCQPRSNGSKWDADLLLIKRRFYLCGSDPVIQTNFTANNSAVNVLLLGIDSLSRLSWHRYLPKTVDKFAKLAESRGTIFKKYHVVGDGTTSNLLAILTGHFEEELPESRRFEMKLLGGQGGLMESQISGDKEYKGSMESPLDKFPWIWNEYKQKAGYATHFIEDTPNWGTFQYRLQGFGNLKPPVDSYGRPCMVAAAYDEKYYGKQLGCTASTPTHLVLLESFREFMYANSHLPRFSLTFLSEMIHEEPSEARRVDSDVLNLLEEIDKEDERGWGPLANTVIILFSDHGPRIGKARLSLQGKFEERLPMLGILFPRKLAQEWPEAVAALQSNTDRLCSPFDLHATLKHILTHSDHHNTRSRSLLTPIPWQRTCNEAGIARHWCTCAQWVTLEPNLAGDWSNEVMRAASLTLESINSATVVLKTSGIRLVGLCEKLKLDRIVSAELSRLPHDVVRFRGSADRDGRIPLFDKFDIQPASSALRLHLKVQPKDAHFEVVLHRDSGSGEFEAPRLENIQRLDRYESHAKCLDSQTWIHARRFCICR